MQRTMKYFEGNVNDIWKCEKAKFLFSRKVKHLGLEKTPALVYKFERINLSKQH